MRRRFEDVAVFLNCKEVCVQMWNHKASYLNPYPKHNLPRTYVNEKAVVILPVELQLKEKMA
jgi:hypothetical protein